MKKCTVTAASNMSRETFEHLCGKLKERFGNDIEPELITDDGVIGGCIIDLDGHIFDLSVRTQLEELRKHMNAANGDGYEE